MTRRAALAVLTGAVIDRERLLWTHGAKLISIPRPRPVELISGWTLAHTFFDGPAILFNPRDAAYPQYLVAREEILRSFGVQGEKIRRIADV